MAADVDSDDGVTLRLRLLEEGPPSVSRRTSTGSVYLTREAPTAELEESDARRLASTSRWLVIDDDESDPPTCQGADGECSRPVEEAGAYCWQHADTDAETAADTQETAQ